MIHGDGMQIPYSPTTACRHEDLEDVENDRDTGSLDVVLQFGIVVQLCIMLQISLIVTDFYWTEASGNQ